MHKPTFKAAMLAAVIDTPRWEEVHPTHSTAHTVSTTALTLGLPVFVKPASGGGSLEAGIASSQNELAALLEKNREQRYTEYMIEECIPGTPATIGVLETDGRLTTLPLHTVEPTARSTTTRPSTTSPSAAQPAPPTYRS